MEVTVKKIGKLSPLSSSFRAFEGCVLYSVQIVSPVEGKVSRLISFSSYDSFDSLSIEAKLRTLLKNELSEDDLVLFLSEYQIVKDSVE